MDPSHGYEAVAAQWLVGRGYPQSRQEGIGVPEVRRWARRLRRGSSILDLGCGPGFPLTAVLVKEGLEVFGLDAAPTLITAFRQNLPGVPVVCADVLESDLFGRPFDAVLAIGLIFLMRAEDQHHLICRFADALVAGGHLLFTAPTQHHAWRDIMTGMPSLSLGAEAYRSRLLAAGLAIVAEYEDSGQNHYYAAVKEPALQRD